MNKKVKILYLIPIGIVVLYTFYLLYKFENIPDLIRIYGYGDKAKFGKKILMFVPILLNALILIWIGFLMKNPKNLNLPIKNDDNKELDTKIQISLIVLSTIISVIFCLLFIDVFKGFEGLGLIFCFY